jgi:hypothetical protein
MTDNTHKKPANFNWVNERATCSLRQMFEKLKLEIAGDVEARNAHLSERPIRRAVNIADHGSRIKVFLDDQFQEMANNGVLFVLKPDGIEVRDNETNAERFKVTIGLNDDGDCKFVIDGKEYDSWQVRRKALEGLLFNQWLNGTI